MRFGRREKKAKPAAVLSPATDPAEVMQETLTLLSCERGSDAERAALRAANWFNDNEAVVEHCGLQLYKMGLDYSFLELLSDGRGKGMALNAFDLLMAEASVLSRNGLTRLALEVMPAPRSLKDLAQRRQNGAKLVVLRRERRLVVGGGGISLVEAELMHGNTTKAAVVTRALLDTLPMVDYSLPSASGAPRILYVTTDLEPSSAPSEERASVATEALRERASAMMPGAQLDVAFFDPVALTTDFDARGYDLVLVQPYPPGWNRRGIDQAQALRIRYGAGDDALRRVSILALRFPDYADQLKIVGAAVKAPEEGVSTLLDFARRAGGKVVAFGARPLDPADGRLNPTLNRERVRRMNEVLSAQCAERGVRFVDLDFAGAFDLHYADPLGAEDVASRRRAWSTEADLMMASAVQCK